MPSILCQFSFFVDSERWQKCDLSATFKKFKLFWCACWSEWKWCEGIFRLKLHFHSTEWTCWQRAKGSSSAFVRVFCCRCLYYRCIFVMWNDICNLFNWKHKRNVSENEVVKENEKKRAEIKCYWATKCRLQTLKSRLFSSIARRERRETATKEQ